MRFKSILAIICFICSSCVSSCIGPIDRGSLSDVRRSLNHKGYGYQIVDDHTGSAPVQKIERFEVRPGDCSSDASWSDCANDRERSELTSGRGAGTYWYGWSIYFPDDFKDISPTKTVFGQFHQHGSKNPAWMFRYTGSDYLLDGQLNGEWRPLIEDQDLRGKWNKIEVHVKWTKKWNEGFMKVYVNGKLMVDYKGRTMDKSSTYFKYGIYRTGISEYKDFAEVDEVPAQVVYYANVKKSKTREGLLPSVK